MRPTFLTDSTLPARPIVESYWVVPGRLLAGEYPGVPYNTEITRKQLDAFLDARFDTFIDLTCAGETEAYQPILCEQAGYYEVDVEYLNFSIGDFGLPTAEQMTSILDAMDHALGRGRKIYLHCFGGIGRTGTTIGCYLIRHGYSGADALHQLAQWWQLVPKSNRYPHSPETVQQEQFIRSWSEPYRQEK